MESDKKKGIATTSKNIFQSSFTKIQINLMETMGLGKSATISALILIVLVAVLIIFLFIRSAPPKTIIMTSGDDGSMFYKIADKYAKVLARNGVKLKIIKSEGSLENLKRLSNPSYRVDVGFVQAGLTKGQNIHKLVSLGSIAYEPLFIFYRGTKPVELLSQFKGKKLAIGPDGSGTNYLAKDLLSMNEIKPGGSTKLLDMDDEEAANDLLNGKVDAVFFMGDSASTQLMRKLLHDPGIRLVNFTQADAYTRRVGYLNKLVLPKGAIDFGENMPDHDVHLIAPSVELIAHNDLHPALSDLLLEAAKEIHGRATLFQGRGEFPVPLEHEFRISDDATRYYKSGKSFLYRYFPFWMASLINRILVVFLPIVLILIPGLRVIPAIYQWGTKMRIYRWYRQLLALEQDMIDRMDTNKQKELLARLDQIEQVVDNMKVPASFAEQFYVLRGHIGFVRAKLMERTEAN
ncbi:MAG: TAXI family TRAP transporter solute-binding subunit [Smithella sp.]